MEGLLYGYLASRNRDTAQVDVQLFLSLLMWEVLTGGLGILITD